MKSASTDSSLNAPLGSSTGAAVPGDTEMPLPQEDGSPADSAGITREMRASIRVLIVDDDRTLRVGCASVLRVQGYNVTAVGRGDEALDLIRRAHFDIVLCDLYMTPISGMEILKTVTELRPGTITIMVTGNPSMASSVEALRAGAWDYLPKPFSGSHLQLLFGRA